MLKSLVLAVLTLAVTLQASDVDIWNFDIDNGPAPSPEDGPPLARNAVRDPAYLKYQIAGIIAGYFAFILLFGLFLLLVGRPLRRKALSTHGSVAIELVKRKKHILDPSPMSPSGSARSWRKWAKPKHLGMSLSGLVSGSAASSRYVKSPKEAIVHTQELSTNPSVNGPGASTQRMPLRLDTSGIATLTAHESATASPRSLFRVVYPPYDTTVEGAVAAPSDVGFTNFTPVHQTPTQPIHRTSPVQSNQSRSTRRMIHKGSRSSLLSRSTSLRSLNISSPIAQPESAISLEYPLSPRYYPEPGPAPVPPMIPEDESRPASLRATPPGTEEETYGEENIYNYTPQHAYHSSSIYDDEPPHSFNSPRPVPLPAPQRHTTGARPFSPPSPPPARTSLSPKPLPFRLLTSNSTSTSPTATSTAHNAGLAAFAASPTRVTFLSPRRDAFNTAATPRTGAFVPYTPYMPFTPITPVTPHLVSRAERLQRRRREAAVEEEDAVKSEGELWGDAYHAG